MSSAFAGCGCDVRLYAKIGEFGDDPFDFYAIERSFEIEYVSEPDIWLLGRIFYGWRAARRFAESDGKADLLYGRDLGSLFVASKLGIPFLFEVHDIHPGRIGRYLVQKLASAKNCLGVVVISTALKHDLVATFPTIHPRDVLVAHDAADDPLDHQGRLCNYLSRDIPNVGYVGHLYRGKGMEVIATIADHLKDTQFTVIGGTEQDIDYWRKQISTSNVLFRGFVPHRDLAAEYQPLDICLLPIQRTIEVAGGSGDIGRWTSPLKLFEYMSYGMPIVASNVPVLREVLVDRVNAVLVDPEDFGGWVRAISELAADAEFRAKIGRRAREDFLAKYSWRARARSILSRIEG